MGKDKQRIIKRIVVLLAVLTLVFTSMPRANSTVFAGTNDEVAFQAASHHKMNVGATYDFDLTNKKAGATYKWTSSNASVATVNKSGVVKALSVGTATITCTVKEGKQTKKLKAKVYVVNAKEELPSKVAINNKISYMAPAESYDLNRTFTPSKTSDYVNWTSSNTNIATVDKNGVVTAIKDGTVKIKVTSLNGKLKDSVTITVSENVVASTQEDINRLVKATNAKKITIHTLKDTELTIPEGNYSNKELLVIAPKATIENYGTFQQVNLKSIKNHTWKEFAKNNILNILCNASVVVDKNASVDINVSKSGLKIKFDIDGTANINVDNKSDITIGGSISANVTVVANAKNTQLHTELPIHLILHSKITVELLSKEAGSSKVEADDENMIPTVKGEGTVRITIGNIEIEVSATVTTTVTPTQTPDSVHNGVPSNDRVEVDANGLDESGRAVAYYGSPDKVDGEIEDIWKKAEPVKLKNYSSDAVTTNATMKVLWDDNAVYFLAEVQDENLSDESGNVYEKDSIEFFLDQDNKRAGTYEGDDCQFRINFKNEQSCDHGDLTNLYSAAKVVNGGYVIEGRVALSTIANNDMVMGFEAQLNDAVGAQRVGTISVFDTTGTAYQDTSKFGEIILVGKKANDKPKPNFYDLQALVISAKDIELERYINGDVVAKLIKESEDAINNPEATQDTYDALLSSLQKAIDQLMHNDLSFDEKECRDIPKAYKTYDPESQRGTIVRVDYKTNTYDEENKELNKYMFVYLPNGYDPEDTTKKYDVMYLIHGMAESQHTAFGGEGQNTELMRAVDNLIADGKMKPMIIVTPTWYDTDPWSPDRNSEDGLFRIKNFHNELVKDIIPTIESKYNVYAKDVTEKELIAARDHRAFGGFSMGSACTWYNYIYAMDYFKYYVPISLWCWQDTASIEAEYGEGFFEGENSNVILAKYLAYKAKEAGYGKDDIRIFCATGTADLAYGGMNAQIEEMKKLDDIFVYSADLRKGNFYYITLPGGAHNWTCVDRYLYNILPDLFHEEWTNDYGLTEKGEATATFGSPKVDGKMDGIWNNATPIVPKYTSTPENTNVLFRAMWDDDALYILAQVKDQFVSKDSVNPYEQDSVEIFVDENNDKSVEFGTDDLQFRVNYANDATADKGDILRLYSATSEVEGGYIIEARIEWMKPVDNDTLVGLELQINDGKGATRVGTINVFDGTNNAWQNTSLFGNLILKGKKADSVTGINPYKLLSLIKSTETLDETEYTNYNILVEAIETAMNVVNKSGAIQEEIDEQYQAILDAIDKLQYTEEALKVKRFVPMPSEYKGDTINGTSIAVSGGAIVARSYKTLVKGSTTEYVDKKYNVYLPYGYDPDDKSTRYNVFYLMHGGGENENTLFGGPNQNLELKRILDIMIGKGEIEPMIVVTPTFNGGEDDIATFYKELLNTLIPQVETEFNTFMTGTGTLDDLIETRDHRAFGGFSMGSACTWYVFINCLDYIKYYVPLSGECWALSGTASSSLSKDTAEYLRDVVIKHGSPDFKIYAATGSGDIAYPNMAPMMVELEKLDDVFIFNQDITKGNTYFMVAEGGTHAWNFVNQYLYNIFPDLFK